MSAPSRIDPQSVKGFLSEPEGLMLAKYAHLGVTIGQIVEIGSWCGRSALYLAPIAAAAKQLLFCVDHHRGSEENQPGWEWFDKSVWDDQAKAIDTLPIFRKNIRDAGFEQSVVAMVGQSPQIGGAWDSALGFLFLDGNHTMQTAMADFANWSRHIAKGGFLAIHDVFPDPADGGRPPFEVCEKALRSGDYKRVDGIDSLVILQRL